jgi:FkbM family methyltransferase
MQIGATQVPMYPTLAQNDIRFILNDAEIKIIFVANAELYQKVDAIRVESGIDLKIYTFDPEPINVKAMTEFGVENCVGNLNDDIVSDSRHIFHPYAMSDVDGKITFHRSRDTGYDDKGHSRGRYSGSIHKPVDQLKGWPHIVFDDSVEVETRTLDSFCKEHDIMHINFIWMDTQGAEGRIFNGGEETLKNIDYVYTEYYNQNMYENQVYFEQLQELLSEFTLIANWKYVDYAYPECNGGDALFVRNDVISS